MRGARWQTVVFVLGVAVVLAALAWVTHHALRLERAEITARAQAEHQELVRLVLWRMDAAVTPILAREAARPYFQYQAFYPAGRAYTRMWRRVEPGEVLVPSPLLNTEDPLIKLYFQRGPEGLLTSPQVPGADVRPLAQTLYVSSYSLALAEQRLGELDSLLNPGVPLLADKLTRAPEPPRQIALLNGQSLEDERLKQADRKDLSQERQQAELSRNEYAARQSAANRANINVPQQVASPPAPAATGAVAEPPAGARVVRPEADNERKAGRAEEVEKNLKKEQGEARSRDLDASLADATRAPQGDDAPKLDENPEPLVTPDPFVARWWTRPGDDAPQLILTRRVELQTGGKGLLVLTQGIWLDWPALQAQLLAQAAGLLPGAKLHPMLSGTDQAGPAVLGRALAAIPAELDAPPPPAPVAPLWSPLRGTLLAAWGVAFAAITAIAFVMRASMELAERRGRFVSAVTHELRTPLTTFCLYSQMLADGMVRDDASQRTYFDTLKRESNRLAGIVESVLDYARLGRPHANHAAHPTVGELLDRLTPPLLARCDQSRMELVVENHAETGLTIAADGPRVERIISNLVDNACKYAAAAEDRRIHLILRAAQRDLSISVRDHGPGVERPETARVFRPFFRGRRQSDGSTPGLGLGLALAKGLAREMHGDLRLDATDHGAQFTLRVPLATASE